MPNFFPCVWFFVLNLFPFFAFFSLSFCLLKKKKFLALSHRTLLVRSAGSKLESTSTSFVCCQKELEKFFNYVNSHSMDTTRALSSTSFICCQKDHGKTYCIKPSTGKQRCFKQAFSCQIVALGSRTNCVSKRSSTNFFSFQSA